MKKNRTVSSRQGRPLRHRWAASTLTKTACQTYQQACLAGSPTVSIRRPVPVRSMAAACRSRPPGLYWPS